MSNTPGRRASTACRAPPAPVTINFLDTAGSVCAALLPTGNARDTVDVDGVGTVDVTCIDNGQPLVMVRAADAGPHRL